VGQWSGNCLLCSIHRRQRPDRCGGVRIFVLWLLLLCHCRQQRMLRSLLLLTAFRVSFSSCVCNQITASSHNDLHHRHAKEFFKATKKGLDYVRPLADQSLYYSAKHRKLAASDTEDCNSEQIHITLGGNLDEVIVSYTSNNWDSYLDYSTDPNLLLSGTSSSQVIRVEGTFQDYSELLYITNFVVAPAMGEPLEDAETIRQLQDTSPWAHEEDGEHWYNWYNVTKMQTSFGRYNNPYMIYTSPILHTIVLTGLQAGITYSYIVADSCQVHSFVMPKYSYNSEGKSKTTVDLFPFRLGLVGDVGQTQVSVESMAALAALETDSILLVGDLSYADGWQNSWDTFGRAFETLASKVPVLTTGGNHELQSGENWLPYYLRYPTPYRVSGSPDPAYWGREVGPVHVIALNSYADYLTNTTIQYRWLKNYLETRINRDRTPWVLVMMHTPWYSTNVIHWREGELMRRVMESLLYSHGVDIVLSGHVHSYERTYPVYDNTLNSCGPTYLIVGDGGNYEGEASPWRADSNITSWSAFREASFGVGGLDVVNSTHAFFSWHRHACGSSSNQFYYQNFSAQTCMSPDDNSPNAMETSDEVWIIRQDQTTCPNKHVSVDYEPVDPSSLSKSSKNNDDDSKYSKETTEVLIILTAFLGALSLALIVGMVYLLKRAPSSQMDKASLV
jgi:acid phosphatase type 7